MRTFDTSNGTGIDAIPPLDGWSFISGVEPRNGGIHTDDAGTVSGPVTLRTEVLPDGEAMLYVQPVGHEHWHPVAGGHYHWAEIPAAGSVRQAERRAEQQVHVAATQLLATGGADAASLRLH
ncbi:hypothetical protein [Fodinicola feengrottensis]|uniref:hypothetical protein n=1 Tax=Fodinicola feengrottensis TaxID=435914 RepID=UPI0013D35608|nr:hypothetical protein [Fodinicola feengrottensis]